MGITTLVAFAFLYKKSNQVNNLLNKNKMLDKNNQVLNQEITQKSLNYNFLKKDRDNLKNDFDSISNMLNNVNLFNDE